MSDGNSEYIQAEFRRRDEVIPSDFYSLSRDVNLFFYHGRIRQALYQLRAAGFFPCAGKRVLEIGCGARGWLPDFEAWGVTRADLAGIELDENRVHSMQRLLSGYVSNGSPKLQGGADIRVGDASQLPWSSESFDAVVQSNVFTSILSDDLKQRVASEMLRVTKKDGLILWYDFTYNNPANASVRGIKLAEVAKLFPGCSLRSRSATLAPPVARRIVPLSWLAGEFLQTLKVLNTHRLIVIKKP
ncbi:class I SAM-dependent methyltransferase [soil metagenome]